MRYVLFPLISQMRIVHASTKLSNFPLDKVSIVDFVENSKKTNSILYLTNEYGKHVVLHS